MKSKRAAKAAVVDPEPKTKGTIWAEENRARCNKLTDAQHEKLQARAWEIIYGRKAAVRRR